MASQTTTEGTQEKETSYLYDVYNNPTNQTDHDWGSGAPGAVLRQTVTAYNTVQHSQQAPRPGATTGPI